MIFCTNCGTKNRDKVEFCKECGKTLVSSEDIYENRWDLYLLAKIPPLLILFIVCAYVILHG